MREEGVVQEVILTVAVLDGLDTLIDGEGMERSSVARVAGGESTLGAKDGVSVDWSGGCGEGESKEGWNDHVGGGMVGWVWLGLAKGGPMSGGRHSPVIGSRSGLHSSTRCCARRY